MLLSVSYDFFLCADKVLSLLKVKRGVCWYGNAFYQEKDKTKPLLISFSHLGDTFRCQTIVSCLNMLGGWWRRTLPEEKNILYDSSSSLFFFFQICIPMWSLSLSNDRLHWLSWFSAARHRVLSSHCLWFVGARRTPVPRRRDPSLGFMPLGVS